MKIDDSRVRSVGGVWATKRTEGEEDGGMEKGEKQMKQRCDFQELCSQKSRELIRVPCSVPAHL